MSLHHDIPSSPIILMYQNQHTFSPIMLICQKIHYNNAMKMIISSLVKIITTHTHTHTHTKKKKKITSKHHD